MAHAHTGLRQTRAAARSKSQIHYDVSHRSRAANKHIAIGGFVERIRCIGNRSRHKPALAVVTYPRPA